ncbi:MAG: hypothetical protein WCH01_17300 [Methylococcaceae bacterium]
MEVLLNELSLHRQFANVLDFQTAVETVMSARSKIRQFGGVLRCHRNLPQAQVTHELRLQQIVSKLDRNKRSALMSWLTKEGPFWEDSRQHEVDDWLESQSQIVTDTALGESAYRYFNGSDYQTFSFEPSNWQVNPIAVHWHRNTDEGNRLYQEHFTGDKAWFSTSSDDEKIEFKNELTFNHPNNKDEKLFCPWHGKIKTPQIRIHFSYPIRADKPLYVPYIGLKITKK